jgi:hypothetical protein
LKPQAPIELFRTLHQPGLHFTGLVRSGASSLVFLTRNVSASFAKVPSMVQITLAERRISGGRYVTDCLCYCECSPSAAKKWGAKERSNEAKDLYAGRKAKVEGQIYMVALDSQLPHPSQILGKSPGLSLLPTLLNDGETRFPTPYIIPMA